MTYAQDEASIEDGDPIELYEFAGSGLVAAFRYTSAEEDVVFDPGGGPETFFAIPIKRSEVSTRSEADAPELSVTVPMDIALAQRYVFQIAPRQLSLTIYRVHQTSGDNSIFWSGKVLGWSVKERLISLRVPNELLGRVNEEIPKFHYQQLCNNVLYDGVCLVARASHQVLATLGPLVGDQKTLTVTPIPPSTMGGNPNGWAVGGEIIHDLTGESRMIMTQIGNTLTILWPFSVDVNAGDNMTIQAGCDHTIAACVNKFTNEDNFTGMPFIISQALNPTQGGE
jgi:uncharacterized phage protein (TIGR02218 family)